MPLTKLSTSIFRTTSTQIRNLNEAIGRYNANPNSINLGIVQGIIDGKDSRVHFMSHASEIMALENAIKSESKALAAATVAGDAGILGPRAVRNLNPTVWVETLFPDAPPLEGVVLEGEAKRRGAQGTPWKMTLPSGKKLIAKTCRSADKASSKASGNETETQREYGIYKTLYKIAGEHPNMVKVWGWADIKIAEQHEEGFIMDQIDGPDGRTLQVELKEAWALGIISTAEYWSSIQYIGRCHLDVIQHLKSAGWLHNDIKHENYVVDSASGEVIVIDLGGAGLIGDAWNAATAEFAAPELLGSDGKAAKGTNGTVASNVFALGATLVHAVEAADIFHGVAKPNRGLTAGATPFRDIANAVEDVAAGRYKNPFEYGAETDYTRQVKRMMNADPLEREKTIDETSNRFLHDSILTDEQTREVLKGIASGSRKRNWEERWLRTQGRVPTLSMSNRMSAEREMLASMKAIRNLPMDTDPEMSRATTSTWMAVFERYRRLFDEAEKAIKQASAFGINTSADKARMNDVRRQFAKAENTVKIAMARHDLVDTRSRGTGVFIQQRARSKGVFER